MRNRSPPSGFVKGSLLSKWKGSEVSFGAWFGQTHQNCKRCDGLSTGLYGYAFFRVIGFPLPGKPKWELPARTPGAEDSAGGLSAASRAGRKLVSYLHVRPVQVEALTRGAWGRPTRARRAAGCHSDTQYSYAQAVATV